jgi:hypothetical protein
MQLSEGLPDLPPFTRMKVDLRYAFEVAEDSNTASSCNSGVPECQKVARAYVIENGMSTGTSHRHHPSHERQNGTMECF